MIQHATARLRGRMRPFIRTGDTVHPEAAAWAVRVAANSGTLGTASLRIASRFMWEVENRTWKNKLLWIAPMLGSNLAAARTPLRDWLGGGLMANTGFVDGDFAENSGLQGDGSSKVLNTNVFAGQLGRGLNTLNGGMGYREMAVDQTGTTQSVMGMIETDWCILVLKNTTTEEYCVWGNPANKASNAVNATSAHYYAQRSAANARTLFRSGSSIASNTTSDTPSTALTTRTIRLLGLDNGGAIAYNKGRCGYAYFTDGTLSTTEALDMHNCLENYLKTPSGK